MYTRLFSNEPNALYIMHQSSQWFAPNDTQLMLYTKSQRSICLITRRPHTTIASPRCQTVVIIAYKLDHLLFPSNAVFRCIRQRQATVSCAPNI